MDHIFPRSLLKKHGMGRSQYNRLSNLTFMDQLGNIKIGDRTPAAYFTAVAEKVDKGKDGVSGLRNSADLKKSLRENCIPDGIFGYDVKDYDDFLEERKELEANTRSSFGLREGLSRPYFVARPSQSLRLCSGLAPRLAARSSTLATKNDRVLASDGEEDQGVLCGVVMPKRKLSGYPW